MVGGFPGGEVGLKIFNATGEVPKTKPPTVGPVGRSLGILVRAHSLQHSFAAHAPNLRTASSATCFPEQTATAASMCSDPQPLKFSVHPSFAAAHLRRSHSAHWRA